MRVLNQKQYKGFLNQRTSHNFPQLLTIYFNKYPVNVLHAITVGVQKNI